MSKNTLATVRSKKVGFVFQGFNLLPRTNALDNVELPLLYNGSGLHSRDRHRQAREALAAVGLTDRGHHHPSQLSGGQQQRVAIARALINEPAILLADEPTGNLDSRTSIEVMDIFQRLNTERGITVLLITHEQDIAEYGTRIIAFRDGRIVSDQPNPVRRVAADELAALPDDDHAVGARPQHPVPRTGGDRRAGRRQRCGAGSTRLPLPPPPADTQESGKPRPTPGIAPRRSSLA